MSQGKRSFLRDAWRLAKPYWTSEEKWSAWGLLLASLAAGLFVAAGILLLRSHLPAPKQRLEITVRGPLSYAGPGSLGGTPSALRR